MSITAAGSTVTNNTPGVATFNTTVTPSAIGDVLVVYMNATRPAAESVVVINSISGTPATLSVSFFFSVMS